VLLLLFDVEFMGSEKRYDMNIII